MNKVLLKKRQHKINKIAEYLSQEQLSELQSSVALTPAFFERLEIAETQAVLNRYHAMRVRTRVGEYK